MINDLANKATSRFLELTQSEPDAIFDPAIIMVFAEIIMQLIEALQDCRQDVSDATKIVQKPTRLQKWVVRSKVKRELGRREYRNNSGAEIVQAILDAGTTLSETDVEELYQEV